MQGHFQHEAIQVSKQRHGFTCTVAEADFALMRNNHSAELDCLHARLIARSNNATLLPDSFVCPILMAQLIRCLSSRN